ncbi:MAG: O-antigen ligase family protein [Candidatus Acidiferrales bacterium]
MILFYFLITQLPLDQDPTWGKFLGAATLIKYVGLVCVFYAIVHLTARHSAPRYLATLQARLFLVFLTLSFFSYCLMGPAFSLRSSPIISYLSMAFLFFVVLSIVDTLPRLRWTILAAVGSMGWASLFVVREWMRDPMWRPGSVAGDANYFALDACLALPLAFLLVWRSRVRWERLFALGCLLVTLGASLLGGSRGGLFALIATCLWLVWHSPHRLRNTTVLAILIIPPLLFFPFSPVRRLAHPKYSDMIGERNRRVAWKAGLRMVEHHPLMGIGLGEFKPQMPMYTDPDDAGIVSIAHNTYLEVAAETGVPNVIIFIIILVLTYRILSRVRRRASDSGPPLLYLAATGMQAGFVGLLVGIFFLSAEYLKFFWLWVFLSMVLPSFLPARIVEKRKKSEITVTSIESVPAGMEP